MPDEERSDETRGEERTEPQAGQQAQDAAEGEARMPEPEIAVIISSLATQALVGLGVMGHPISKQKETDLESAKFSIDLLQVLQDKTKGNLSDLENRFLETILHDLRMKFVEASK